MTKNTLLILAFIFQTLSFAAKEEVIELPWEPLPKVAPSPKDNPTSPGKVSLGRQLFHDPRLSIDGTVSCASCHNTMGSGADNRAFSAGVGAQLSGRSAPTVWNATFHSVQFWDGRAATLEEQAKGPITNPKEMGMKDSIAVVERLKEIPGYVTQFEKVFGKKALTMENVAKAIAAYERTLITPDSPFDRYVRGNKKAMSAQAIRGMDTVIEAGCVSCHTGRNFNGPTDLELGVGFYQKFPTFVDNDYVKKYDLMKDLGRFEHTKTDGDQHFYRVPTWRNVALTAPYFHNGSVKTLDEAVRVMAKVQLDKELSKEQVADIVEFLRSLTGVFPKQEMPRLPETVGISLVDR